MLLRFRSTCDSDTAACEILEGRWYGRLVDVDAKREAQKQWTADPCGASTTPEHEPGTPEFYRKIEHERYEVYAPWMRGVMGFAGHAGDSVLEIGPGLGTDHAQFARAGARMTAIDLTARHLQLTRRRFEIEGLVTRPVRGDAEGLPFADCVFDVVYSFGVLHHTPDTEGAVQEIHRVLRPGGLAIVGLYHRHSAFHWIGTVLWNGLLRGEFRRKSYPRLLSDIEFRSPGSDAVPLVKVLSRSDCRRMFRVFAQTSVRTDHIEWSQLVPTSRFGSGPSRSTLEALFRRWGWYLTVFARK
jgi:SAM-dependent methyltransferase